MLFERVAPMGALVAGSGPAVGRESPSFHLTGIQSEPVRIGGLAPRPTLVFFLSHTCPVCKKLLPVCKKLLPVLKSLQRDEGPRLAVVLASDGEAAAQTRALRRQILGE